MMRNAKRLALISFCLMGLGHKALGANSTPSGRPEIKTQLGLVKGVRAPDDVELFLGIPYAEPPIRGNRWKAPVPKAPWAETFEADHFGSACVQSANSYDSSSGAPLEVKGSEDCLSLNIYRKLVDERASLKPIMEPVMVWIHGGAFVNGASEDYDPRELARKEDVIVVTLNYRLGALGFLAHAGFHSEAGESGNYGLLDQQMAMKWVRDNITAFGGDADRITLFGESAGGASVCSHLISPSAQGLFAHAIVQSGLCSYKSKEVALADAEVAGESFATRAGCIDQANQTKCLRALSVQQIAGLRSSTPGIEGAQSWSAVWGGKLLPRPESEAFEKGLFHRVPILSGTNKDEGHLFISSMAIGREPFSYEESRSILKARFGAMTADLIEQEYPISGFASPSLALSSVLTDSMFSCPALKTHRSVSQFVKTYAYEFADENAPLNFPVSRGFFKTGAYHAAEITYLFQTRWALADPAQFTSSQKNLADQMMRYWGSFARTGNPNQNGLPNWPEFKEHQDLIRFVPGAVGTTGAFSSEHKCEFWLDLR